MSTQIKNLNGDSQNISNKVHASPRGFIEVDTIYTIEEFKRRLDWKSSTLRAARRRGLRVLRSGKRAFVFGQDFFEFLKKESND